MLPLTWQDDTSFSEFLDIAFPSQSEMNAAQNDVQQQLMSEPSNKWHKLTGKRLKR